MKTSDELKLIKAVAEQTVTRVKLALDQGLGALDAAIAQVMVDENTPQPPPVPPPLPPDTPTAGQSLAVDGATLKTRSGAPFLVRGIELMYGQNAAGRGQQLIRDLKSLGANTLSPLFQGQYGSESSVRQFLAWSRTEGVAVGVNADHQPDGRGWLCQSAIVAACNDYAERVILCCEIETDPSNPTDDQWQASASWLVSALRQAGHKSLIKVGAPQGGRRIGFALRRGAAVRAADPLKNVCFTAQLYWKGGVLGGWSYQADANDFDPPQRSDGQRWGIDGTRMAVAAMAGSGLCFIAGLDWRDDIGPTDLPAIAAACDQHNVSWQHWVATGDGAYPENNLLDWAYQLSTLSATGTQISAALKIKSTLGAL